MVVHGLTRRCPARASASRAIVPPAQLEPVIRGSTSARGCRRGDLGTLGNVRSLRNGREGVPVVSRGVRKGRAVVEAEHWVRVPEVSPAGSRVVRVRDCSCGDSQAVFFTWTEALQVLALVNTPPLTASVLTRIRTVNPCSKRPNDHVSIVRYSRVTIAPCPWIMVSSRSSSARSAPRARWGSASRNYRLRGVTLSRKLEPSRFP